MYKLLYFFVVLATGYADIRSYVEPVQTLAARDPRCSKRNSYYPLEMNCDAYVECTNYLAQEMLCPDGLHFNPDAAWPAYPCGYPSDVPCRERLLSQPAHATADCPHEYGFYPSPSAGPDRCGHYHMCVKGQPIERVCPPGLAFDAARATCDWPDLVASCDAQKFLGFTCPPHPVDAIGQPLDVALNYKYPNNCYYFFSCRGGHARLMSCDPGFAFDETTGRCVDGDLVPCAYSQ